jgi:hypothetical protein
MKASTTSDRQTPAPRGFVARTLNQPMKKGIRYNQTVDGPRHDSEEWLKIPPKIRDVRQEELCVSTR